MSDRLKGVAGLLPLVAVLSICAGGAMARDATPPAAGSSYVAMGSSYAAGPGVTTSADTPPTRCQRSMDNYAHQIARRHGLKLIDVSCSGARTEHLLGPWRELPPQLDAVDSATRLVTVTIGGNDVGYVGGLIAASCRGVNAAVATQPRACPTAATPDEASFSALEARLRQVASEVRRRAPAARLVFVDYPAVLPDRGLCAATPMGEAEAEASRRIAARVVGITARVARDSKADLIAASRLTRGHDACAADAWMNGYPQPGVPFSGAAFHPRLAGMTAIADALDRLIWR